MDEELPRHGPETGRLCKWGSAALFGIHARMRLGPLQERHAEAAERLGGPRHAFAAYLAEQTARRTSQLFGHAFLSGYEQLGWRGVELVRRLAAWDPGERLSANAALKSEYFVTLDTECPSASQAPRLGTAADPPSSVDSP